MTSAPIVHVDQLVKEFSRAVTPSGPFASVRRLFSTTSTTTRAVDGVSFDIAPGELVGYLGANGAGKSTTIKMLTGILVPTSGTVTVDGRVPWQDRQLTCPLCTDDDWRIRWCFALLRPGWPTTALVRC